MSDKQWRPPLAPKPASVSLHPPATAQSRDVSPALRGATLAFSHQVHNNDVLRAQTARTGASQAAAAAGKRQPTFSEADSSSDVRRPISPVRGRSMLTLDLDRASRTLQTSILTPSSLQSPPPLNRSASEMAARVASSRTSPARSSGSSASRPVSPQRRLQQLLARDAANRNVVSSVQEPDTDAIRGAAKSMSAHPVPPVKSPHLNALPKPDLRRLPSVTVPRSMSPVPSSTTPTTATVEQPETTSVASPITNTVHPHADVVQMKVRAPSPPLRQIKMSTGSSVHNVSTPTKRDHVHESVPPKRDAHVTGSIETKPTLKNSLPVPIPPPPRKTSPRIGPVRSPNDEVAASSPITADSLANAMVASSLASSRVQSPAPAPRRSKLPPLPHRRSRSLHEQHRISPVEQRPPKPLTVRPMRQTLRNHSGKDDEEEESKRGRKHLIRKHPHKHAEGDRKRWRDKITERERKRYEGVWAANRGILNDYETYDLIRYRSKGTVPQDLVINVVVRDIWERSRLPKDVLEEVWDLVTDSEDIRALSREEFVVGMWLIDQRLKGRKLPVKVSASVWGSVRWASGVKVRNRPL
jgi:hypothetical protein